MTLETINNRIANAQVAIEKKNGNITRKKKLLARKEERKATTTDDFDALWLSYDIRSLKDDIERLEIEFRELIGKLERYQIIKEKLKPEPKLP